MSPAVPQVLGGFNEGTLQREPLKTPESLADGLVEGLQFADPESGLAAIAPPEASSDGGAQLSYPLVMPKGRGLTPEITLDYDSSGASGWVGYGWDLSVGDVSVDTAFGAPLFCPRVDTEPTCGNYESESYRLNGDLLAPTAVRTDLQPRVAERADFTRKVESDYEHIIRHGDSPKNYFWEVRDKAGNISWYGGFPDEGGPFGAPGTRTGAEQNDRTIDASSILTDEEGNASRWYLKAQRDVGVNMIRYEYDTVFYQAEDTADGVAWTEVSEADCDDVCGKHIYLSKVFYTGAAEASGQPEAPAYEVSFVRGARRADPVIDGRGGVLDVDIEKLTSVVVRFNQPNGDQAKVVRYDLDTASGQFGKTMLTAVHQTGCATGDTCTDSTKATHEFSYYDDVDGEGFADPATWNTRDDDLGDGRLEGKSGALGMSESNAGDGHVYIGFNPAAPTKVGSFGGSLTFDGADTDSLAEFLDINGDTLPDKVFSKDGKVWTHLNTSQPGHALDAQVTFEEAKREIVGLDDLPRETEFGVSGGIEAFFGISAMFNAGGSWNWSKGYFSDVNGDGLVDWVKDSSVLFNHLACSGNPEVCVPTFSDSDGETRAPLNIRPVAGAADESLQETLGLLRRLSPPVDTIRRWTAPFDGVVEVDAPAQFGGDTQTACTATDGVLLALQHNDDEIGRCVLTATGQGWDAEATLTVGKGDQIYFRLGPDPALPSTLVEWNPKITYTSFAHSSGSAVLDENGKDPAQYDASADFDLAGRPNGFVGMPAAGTIRYSGVVEKQVTTDYVRPNIRHYHGSSPDTLEYEAPVVTAVDSQGDPDPARQKLVVQRGSQWCNEYPSGTQFACFPDQDAAQAHLTVLFPAETGRFRIESQFGVDAPVTDSNGALTQQDRVEFLLAVDSPIDPTALHWVRVPGMCYVENGLCADGKPKINPPVDTEIYPVHSNAAPRVPYDPPNSTDTTVRVDFDALGNIFEEFPGGTIFVTVKGSDGSLFRHQFSVPDNGSGHYDNRDMQVSLDGDVRYWFDVSVREPGLYEVLRNGDVYIKVGEDSDGNPVWHNVNPASSYNGTGRQGYFGLGNRGWAFAGYLGSGDRRTTRINEDDLTIPTFEDKEDACQAFTDGPCRTDNDGLDFPGQYGDDYGAGGPGFDPGSVESRFENAYAFVPQRQTDEVTGQVSESWDGPKETFRGTKTTMSASRLGNHIPNVTPSLGSIAPPTLKGQVSPSLALTGGVGPLTASFGVGWSNGDVDYLDMNGDGYPDVVRDDSIEYTDPRGGHVCLQDGGAFEACTGDGVGALNEEITLGASGGLSGSPVGIKGNARGKTNASNGGAAAKGGRTSKDAYSASVGAGFEVAGSWTAPVAKAPGWDDEDHGAEATFDSDDFSEIPGDPMGDEGTQLQRMIADVNGDGLPDQVKTKTQGVFVKLNLGYDFAPEWILWTPDSGFETGESYSGATSVSVGFAGFFKDFSGGVSRNASLDFPRYTWDDVNGDGILDAMYKASDEVRVGFGTGSGVMAGQKYGDMGSVEFDVLGEIGVETNDQVRQQSGVGWGGGFDFTIGIGPLCVAACYLIINPGAHFEQSLSITDVDLQDVNGDGYADSVNRFSEDGNKEKLEVRLNTQRRTGLLKSVENPLGGTMTLDYERKGNTLEHPDSTWVMSTLSVDDGRPGDGPTATNTFGYDDLLYDFVNREDLGFGVVTTRELGSGGQLRTTQQTYANDNIFEAGLQTKIELYDGEVSPDNLLQRSVADWSVLDGETQAEMDAPSLTPDDLLTAWATPLLLSLREEYYEKGETSPSRATATSYEYDRLGNPTTIRDRGDLTTDDDDVIADVEYTTCENAADEELAESCGDAAGDPANQPAFWNDQLCPTWTSLPAIVQIKDNAGTVLRYRDGSNALCNNSSVTILRELISGTPDDGEFAETQLQYDDWGSYDRIVYPVGGNKRHYAVHYEYDIARHSDVAQVTEYDLTEKEVKRFLDYPTDTVDASLDNAEVWLEGTVDSVTGSGFTMTVLFDANDDGDTDDPGDSTVITVDADVPGWVQVGETALAFGVLDGDTLEASGVYRDFNEPWGDVVDPPLEAHSVGLTSHATFNGRAGQVASRTDANGDSTNYDYDALGRTSRIQTPDGGTITYEYSPSNAGYAYARAYHSDEFNPGNTIDTVTFVDGIGRVTQQKQETAIFQGVDQAPLNGFYVSGAVKFDALGRVTEEAQPTFEAMGNGNTFKPRDPATPSTLYTHDLLDRIRSEMAPDGRVTTTAYNFVSGLDTTLSAQEVTDPLLRKSTTFTDARDYTRAIDDKAVGKPALRTSYTNDLLGQLLSVTSAGQVQVEHSYDLLGRRKSTATQDAGTVEFGYDAVGNQVSKQSSVQRADNDSKTTYDYSFGHLVGIKYPDATPDVTLTWGGYNGAPTTDHGAGRVTRIEDAARHQDLGYDENGLVDSESTAMTDDHWKMGNLKTTWDHDWLGRLRTMTYPDTEKMTQGYDLGGQLKSVSGEKACKDLGILTVAVDASQTTITVTEGPNTGPPPVPFTIRLRDEQLQVTARVATATPGVYTYTVVRGINGTDLLPTAASHGAGTSVVSDAPITCTYRYLDRLEYDLYGAPAFQQVGNDNRTQYVRNPLNRRLTRQVTTAPQQGTAAAGTLVNTVNSAATSLRVKESYEPPVLPFVATIGNERVNVTARSSTATAGEFTWTVVRGVGGTSAASQGKNSTVKVDRVEQNLAYTYDKVGNITRYVNDMPPDVPSLFGGKVTQTYHYDPYYRLDSSTGVWNDSQNTRHYEYSAPAEDSTGNVTSKHQKVWDVKVGCKKNCIDLNTELTYDFTDVAYSSSKQHQLVTQGGESFTYDLDGNITDIESDDNLREMEWNAEGKMTMIVDRPNGSGGKPTHLTYDFNGELAIEDKEQGRSWYVNPWVTVENGTTWKNIFAGDERLGVKYSQDGYEQKVYFVHKDVQGTSNIMTDRTGGIFQHQEYLPTGEAWVNEDSTIYRTPYQFSGAYFDEDHGLADFGHRWFESRGQFFYSADPAVLDEPTSTLEDPRLQSVYSLGFGNGVSYVDPDGRKPFEVTRDQRAQILGDLRSGGVKTKRYPGLQQDINVFFSFHDGLRGRLAFSVLNNYKKFARLQDFAEKFDQTPLVEFVLVKGSFKLRSVNVGAGYGKQKKFAIGSAQPGAALPAVPAGPAVPTAPSNAAPPAAQPPPPLASPKPPRPPRPATLQSGAPTRSDGGN